ncbi:hypothetical protein LC040_02400 [Bacillus tianshenii]|nr:hypothetical protein LC040_02400 [Bacillus tianshenii]
MIQPRNGQAPKIGQRVRVYKNLHKNVFSIQDAKTRRVIAYGDAFLLRDVEMKVSKAGQARVRREKRKNVHAVLVGSFAGEVSERRLEVDALYYNPYRTDLFIEEKSGKPVLGAECCLAENGKCYVSGKVHYAQ